MVTREQAEAENRKKIEVAKAEFSKQKAEEAFSEANRNLSFNLATARATGTAAAAKSQEQLRQQGFIVGQDGTVNFNNPVNQFRLQAQQSGFRYNQAGQITGFPQESIFSKSNVAASLPESTKQTIKKVQLVESLGFASKAEAAREEIQKEIQREAERIEQQREKQIESITSGISETGASLQSLNNLLEGGVSGKKRFIVGEAARERQRTISQQEAQLQNLINNPLDPQKVFSQASQKFEGQLQGIAQTKQAAQQRAVTQSQFFPKTGTPVAGVLGGLSTFEKQQIAKEKKRTDPRDGRQVPVRQKDNPRSVPVVPDTFRIEAVFGDVTKTFDAPREVAQAKIDELAALEPSGGINVFPTPNLPTPKATEGERTGPESFGTIIKQDPQGNVTVQKVKQIPPSQAGSLSRIFGTPLTGDPLEQATFALDDAAKESKRPVERFFLEGSRELIGIPNFLVNIERKGGELFTEAVTGKNAPSAKELPIPQTAPGDLLSAPVEGLTSAYVSGDPNQFFTGVAKGGERFVKRVQEQPLEATLGQFGFFLLPFGKNPAKLIPLRESTIELPTTASKTITVTEKTITGAPRTVEKIIPEKTFRGISLGFDDTRPFIGIGKDGKLIIGRKPTPKEAGIDTIDPTGRNFETLTTNPLLQDLILSPSGKQTLIEAGVPAFRAEFIQEQARAAQLVKKLPRKKFRDDLGEQPITSLSPGKQTDVGIGFISNIQNRLFNRVGSAKGGFSRIATLDDEFATTTVQGVKKTTKQTKDVDIDVGNFVKSQKIAKEGEGVMGPTAAVDERFFAKGGKVGKENLKTGEESKFIELLSRDDPTREALDQLAKSNRVAGVKKQTRSITVNDPRGKVKVDPLQSEILNLIASTTGLKGPKNPGGPTKGRLDIGPPGNLAVGDFRVKDITNLFMAEKTAGKILKGKQKTLSKGQELDEIAENIRKRFPEVDIDAAIKEGNLGPTSFSKAQSPIANLADFATQSTTISGGVSLGKAKQPTQREIDDLLPSIAPRGKTQSIGSVRSSGKPGISLGGSPTQKNVSSNVPKSPSNKIKDDSLANISLVAGSVRPSLSNISPRSSPSFSPSSVGPSFPSPFSPPRSPPSSPGPSSPSFPSGPSPPPSSPPKSPPFSGPSFSPSISPGFDFPVEAPPVFKRGSFLFPFRFRGFFEDEIHKGKKGKKKFVFDTPDPLRPGVLFPVGVETMVSESPEVFAKGERQLARARKAPDAINPLIGFDVTKKFKPTDNISIPDPFRNIPKRKKTKSRKR